MTIYLVDDDESFSTYVARELKKYGHNIKKFSSGLKALEKISEDKPDVIVSDWYIRGEMFGSELVDPILKKFPQMKFIFMSGAVTEIISDAIKSLKYAGEFPVLPKGLDSDQLVVQLQEQLSHIESLPKVSQNS